MKEKSKKIISVAIVLFIVLNYFVPVINYAEDNTKEGTELQTETEEISREYEIKETEEWDISENGDKSIIAKWNLADKSITISGKGNMKDWNYNAIEDWHGKYKKVIEKVVINDGITNIGDYVFGGCSSLKEIIIPNSVTRISDVAFKRCSSLEEIKVSSENKNYTSIDGVLYNKDKTKIIAYPADKSGEKYNIFNSVTSIESFTFSGCSSLKEITIPSGVTSIGSSAFSGCSNLEEITIPSSVTNIGDNAFAGCSSLKEITIPSSVTNIEYDMFSGCSSLKEIIIPSSVTSIGQYAFYRCSSLEEIIIPSSVTSISYDAFGWCSSLKEIKVSSENKNYTSIDGVLYNKNKTKIVVYPANKQGEKYSISSSVISIGHSAFEGCSSLKEITIPSSVTSIGTNAVYGVKCIIICKTNSYAHKYAEENKINYYLLDNEISQYTDLYEIKKTEEWDISENGDKSVIAKWNWEDKSITISGKGNMKDWKYNPTEDWHGKYKKLIEKVNINNGITNIGNYAFEGCSSLKKLTIPNSITSIESYAFYECSSLEEITIPSSITSMGDYAFKGCSSLKEIIIPNSVTSTGFSTFFGCSSLKEIIIPNSITSIESYAFSGCSSLEEITIPSSVTSIGVYAFSGCSNLKEIKVSSESKNYTSIEGVLYNKDKTKIIAYPANKLGEKYNILNSVTRIESSTFYGCSSLKEIIIPNSVTSIGYSTFSGCSSLKEIIIPNSVISIGFSAFSGCSSLEEITIPNSVTSIKSGAFEGCSNLVEITIPNSVTSIESRAFYGCKSLKEITIPNRATSIGTYAFYGCKSLKEITIPNSVTSLERDAFSGCSSLKEIIIPNSITSIDSYAFEGCSSLGEITIPSSVTSIGLNAFYEVRYIICKTNSYVHKCVEENKVPYILDEKPPEIKIEYSITKIINKNVTAIITSNEKLQEVVGWTLSEDKKTLTREYEQNAEEEIIVKDLIGNEAKQAVKITNIDKTAPIINVDYTPKELTNKNVIATITSNEKLQEVVGWTLSADKKTLTKEYSQNIEEEIIVKDLAGNEVKQTIKIANIVQATGDVSRDGVVNIGDLLKLKQHMAQQQSEITRAKHPDWKLDEEKILIGDVNKNGKIDVGDILKLQRYIAATKSKEIAERHSDWLNL